MEQDYELLTVLGEGAFGKVYQARHRQTSDLVAVKEIKLGSRSWDEARRSTELQALQVLRSPFIVRLQEVIRSQSDGSLYYVFEYIASDLSRYLKQYPTGLEEQKAVVLARQLFTGLAHMHQHSFFHRDLKPENVLFDPAQETIRICDFGQARSIRARPPFTDYVGTRWYRAPECLLRDQGYSSPIDVWASGLIFAELLRGSPLFPGASSLDQLYRILAVFGYPSNWDEFERLVKAARIRLPQQHVPNSGLQAVVPPISETTLAALEAAMTLNPRRRPTARHCLELPVFAALPPIDSTSPVRQSYMGHSGGEEKDNSSAADESMPGTHITSLRTKGTSLMVDSEQNTHRSTKQSPSARYVTDAEFEKILSESTSPAVEPTSPPPEVLRTASAASVSADGDSLAHMLLVLSPTSELSSVQGSQGLLES